MGQLDHALAEFRISARLDPLSPGAVQSVAYPLYLMRHYEAAAAQYQEALALDENWGPAHEGLGFTYLAMGKLKEGLEETELARKLLHNDPMSTGQLGYAYGLVGETTLARQILLELENRQGISAFAIAKTYIGLKDIDHAFEWLEKSYQEGDNRAGVTADPIFDRLRADRRFVDFSQKYHRSRGE
jgi:tetratricopeptide (TPR) repeat protein